jgi:hypothetical protein
MLQLRRLFSLIIFCLLFTYTQAQSNYSSYVGTWKWTGDRGDTFIIVLKPYKGNVKDSLESARLKKLLIGGHRYIEHENIIESNLHLLSDTIWKNCSISGWFYEKMSSKTSVTGDTTWFTSNGYDTSKLLISMHEIIRTDLFYTGTITLMANNPKKAIWSVNWDRPHLFFPSQPQLTKRRLIPNNIVLEKIAD